MSLAIQWGYYSSASNPEPITEGFLYFDCVTAYKRSFSGSVSKNPIDALGVISDHFTRDNSTITLSVIMSAVDISVKNTKVQDEDGNTPTNSKEPVRAVQVNSDDKSLVNFLPASLGQFFTPQKPQVNLAIQSSETLDQIRDLLESLFLEDNVELVTLYEYTKGELRRKPIKNLVMTNLTFSEDADSGEGLFCDITLEQINFATARSSALPSQIKAALVAQDLAKKAEETTTKGKVDSVVQSTEVEQSIALNIKDKLTPITTVLVKSAIGDY